MQNNIQNFFKSNTEKLKSSKTNPVGEIKEEKVQNLNKPWVEKYRPNNLEEVAYQNNVINALKVTKETGKLPHLLFYGPPGTGKTSTVIAVRNLNKNIKK
jgi:replication factor C subunit 2/4